MNFAFVILPKAIILKLLTFTLLILFPGSVFFSNKTDELLYSSKTIFHTIGSTQVPIKIEQYGTQTDLVYINLHDDEFTSVEATRKLLEKEGGTLIRIENKGKRNIQFRFGNHWFEMDPNRIFSRQGITEFFKSSSKYYNQKVVEEVEKLGQRIIMLFPKDPVCIIALHNNTNGLYSINDYLPGSLRASDAAKVFANPQLDPDDHFLTTESEIYYLLTKKNYNTILQDNQNCKQDGSLSVHCGNKGIRYVNLETEHGKTQEYSDMVNDLYEILSKKMTVKKSSTDSE